MTTRRTFLRLPDNTALIAMASLWVLLLALAVGAQAAMLLPTPGVVLLAVVLALPLSAQLFWRQRLRRRAVLTVYLVRHSELQRWLAGGIWMYLGQLGLALGLSLLLLSGLTDRNDTPFWLLLAALVPLWVFSYRPVARLLAPHLNTDYRTVLVQRLHGWLWGVLLLLMMTGWALYQPVPNLTGASMEAAILEFTDTTRAQSPTLQAVMDVLAGLEGLRYWLAQNVGPDGMAFTLVIWLLILVQEWLLVWPLLLLFQAVHRLTLRAAEPALASGDQPHAPH